MPAVAAPPCPRAGSRTNASLLPGYVWAFAALRPSPGARAHYDRRRATGDRHIEALRNLTNRLLGCLHHSLQTGTVYAE